MPSAARTLLALLVLILCAPARTAVAQCGDADASGAATVTDGVLVLRTAAGLTGGCTLASRCDVDGSGAITVTDGVAALRIAAGLPVETACVRQVVDVSGFAVFDFGHFASFGYCPRIGSPTRFLLFENGGRLVRNATVLVEGTPGDPDCIPDAMPAPPAACVKTMQLPERALTDEEVGRVRQVFASITLEPQRNPDCGTVAIEPCLIERFAWDTFAVTDFACGAPRLPPDQAARLDALMQSLL